MRIRVREELALDGVPSGSALDLLDDKFYLFGDDSPLLHIFTTSWLPLETIELPGLIDDVYRIPKPIKPDIESAFFLRTEEADKIFALGSGSLSPNRDTVFVVNINRTNGWVDIERVPTNIYERLRALLPPGDTLNIEGSCLVGNTLYLAQRGHLAQKNYLFSLPFTGEESFHNSPEISIQPVDLHEIFAGGGLSGLGYDDNFNRLWFCGSLEHTANAYDDGDILGSFLGFFDMSRKEICPAKYAWIDIEENKRLNAKLESIVILESTARSAVIAGIADDDLGGTQAYTFELSW